MPTTNVFSYEKLVPIELRQEVQAALDNQDKPVVHYIKDDWAYIRLGYRASVYALDHPRLGEQAVDTSAVLSIDTDEAGDIIGFETFNTKYVEVKLTVH